MAEAPQYDAVARVRESFGRALESEPAYGEMLPFFQALYELQEAAAETARPAVMDPAAGRPLLERARIPLDLPCATELLQGLLAAAGDANRDLAESAARLRACFEGNGARSGRCLRLFMEQGGGELAELSETVGVAPVRVAFFLYNSIWPSVAFHTRRLAAEKDAGGEGDSGSCPLCGSLPEISFIEENGRRMLACSFCRHQWPVPRIQCPFCRNGDAEALGYHGSEEDPSRRIDTCERCGSYWITIDTRRLGRPFYAPLEALVSTHLDIRAEQMGYGRTEAAGDTIPVAAAEITPKNRLPMAHSLSLRRP